VKNCRERIKPLDWHLETAKRESTSGTEIWELLKSGFNNG